MGETQTVLPEHSDRVPDVTAKTFQAACELQIRPVKDEQEDTSRVLVAIFSLAKMANWATFLGLSESAVVSLAKRFARFEIPFESEDMEDAIGELANPYVQQLKGALEERSADVEVSLPGMFRSDNIQVFVDQASPVQLNRYKCHFGKIWSGVIAT